MPYKDPEVARAYAKDYYPRWNADHPLSRADTQKRTRRKRKDRTRERLDKIKSVPCMDCGGSFPPECMDFDHVHGDKVYAVSDLAYGSGGSNWSLVEAEIAKCEIVCANCHRIRTKQRRDERALLWTQQRQSVC